MPAAGTTATGPVILIPVFNDWESFRLLIERLDEELANVHRSCRIVVVDDASVQASPESISGSFKSIETIVVLALRRNVGHQRAIAIGLSYICDQYPRSTVLVMDADGEDSPSDVPNLFEFAQRNGNEVVVFARRSRRSEALWFRLCYSIYKSIFHILTGHSIHFGNFSVIPPSCLSRVVAVSEIWNHYSAGIMRARIPYRTIDTRRGNRLSGRSSMSLVSLVTHGFSSMAVFSETVGTRLSIAAMGFGVLVLLAVALVIGIRLFTDLAIPGWATYVVGTLLLMLMQVGLFCFVFLFLTLSSRNLITFIPQQSYRWFILEDRKLLDR